MANTSQAAPGWLSLSSVRPQFDILQPRVLARGASMQLNEVRRCFRIAGEVLVIVTRAGSAAALGPGRQGTKLRCTRRACRRLPNRTRIRVALYDAAKAISDLAATRSQLLIPRRYRRVPSALVAVACPAEIEPAARLLRAVARWGSLAWQVHPVAVVAQHVVRSSDSVLCNPLRASDRSAARAY